MVIQELKPSQRVEGRWLAVLEDGSILRIGENEVVCFSLYVGKELTPQETDELLSSVHRSTLKEKALALLTRKPQSRRELERKLAQWEATGPEIEEICDRLEELGYLNDPAYAAQVVRYYSARGFGEKKLRDELYRRGIPRQLWAQALLQAEDIQQGIDAYLEKKLGGARPDGKEMQKVSAALARRGYAWSDINDALRRYGAEVWEDG